jgi:hypothetical protein
MSAKVSTIPVYKIKSGFHLFLYKQKDPSMVLAKVKSIVVSWGMILKNYEHS